jgi:hypothetical protein
MAISRAQLLKELLPGLNALFGMEYARYGEEHKEIYESETSERSFEEETKLSGFSAAPVKNEGSAIAYDNAQEAWSTRYTHETIALGFSITEEAIEDNLYDSLSGRYTKSLARAMAYTKQVKAAAVLNNGFSSSYPGGDGVSLFNASHPLISGGTNSNTPSTQIDLNETSLEAAVIQIAAWTDERGLLIAAKPKKMVVPPNLMFVAKRLLDTELRVSTADNDINAIKQMGAIPEGYTVNHFLTDTNAWFLTTDVPNGMKHFVRSPLANSMDGDFDTGNVRYKALWVCGVLQALPDKPEGGLVPPFLLVYIATIPGFPVYLTVPADDMQTDTLHLHVRKKSWQIPRSPAQSYHKTVLSAAHPLTQLWKQLLATYPSLTLRLRLPLAIHACRTTD